jgi:hypothetical protein
MSGTEIDRLGGSVNRGRRLTSVMPPFTPGTSHTTPSLIAPWNARGAKLIVQNTGANPAQLWKSTSTGSGYFGFPGTDAGFNISVPAGSEYMTDASPFALWAISPLGTTLQVIIEMGADAL